MSSPTNLQYNVNTDEIAPDAITTPKIDTSITPTWTGQHTFDSGLAVSEGQGIEDGGGTERLTFLSVDSRMKDDAGTLGVQLISGTGMRFHATANEPWQINDSQQGSPAIQYDTDSTAGVLRTPNAGMRVEGNGNPSSGAGIEIYYDGFAGLIQQYDRTNSEFERLKISGDDIQLNTSDSAVDLSQNATDLLLATGQSIKDGGKTSRVGFVSNGSLFKDENGDAAFFAGSAGYDLSARSGTPLRVQDREGDFKAVQYTTSASAPGTLELTNADLDAAGNDINNVGAFEATKLSYNRVDATLSSGAVDYAAYLNLFAESGSSDDLSDINGGSDGDVVLLRAEDSITIKHDSGSSGSRIYLQSGQDFTLDSSLDRLALQYDGGTSRWTELYPSNVA